VKIFADGADLETMIALAKDPVIAGFTTNPTLMRKAEVSAYEPFARKILESVTEVPVSFEVFADEADEMLRQARTIASWADNVHVKIPVTNTVGISTAPVVRELSREGVQVNVTAVMTLAQVQQVAEATAGGSGHIVSVFAGRIADTGRDPVPVMRDALAITSGHLGLELLWASPREVLNVRQAEDVGVDIITVTPDLLEKTRAFGKDLLQFSLETVQMFHRDAATAGYVL
jgi:transaldolase